MKTLNLDTFAKAERTITIAGKTYEVMEMTVENFIETTRAAERLGDSASFVDQVEETISMILRSVPTIDRDVLKKLSLEQMTTIVKFIRGDMDEQIATEGEDKSGKK